MEGRVFIAQDYFSKTGFWLFIEFWNTHQNLRFKKQRSILNASLGANIFHLFQKFNFGRSVLIASTLHTKLCWNQIFFKHEKDCQKLMNYEIFNFRKNLQSHQSMVKQLFKSVVTALLVYFAISVALVV